jgi:hypothetical protein
VREYSCSTFEKRKRRFKRFVDLNELWEIEDTVGGGGLRGREFFDILETPV